ncbi:STAS domain-containing protein [Nonomuraea pusilla]|uniref:STAS domain-containing protein n=1 Tax=Nonomuraea pusilla TaxID=46177 RepID=UPI00332D637C
MIALRGELAAATAADLAREVEHVLAGRPAAVVVVDVSRLAFCDFEGVGALIGKIPPCLAADQSIRARRQSRL